MSKLTPSIAPPTPGWRRTRADRAPRHAGSALVRSLAALAAIAWLGCAAGSAAALPRPAHDPFYRYEGATPLAQVQPGTVLKTRKVPYHALGLRTPITAVQLLYRSTDVAGRATLNATSIVLPPAGPRVPKVIAYQSAYDSLSADDQPSYAIAGGNTFGGVLASGENALMVPLLLAGYTVAIADTEGQDAHFAAGPEYGMNTLDGLRAAFNSPWAGLRSTTKVGLVGYSGGAIGTSWATEMAPTYAPDINARLVGSAYGGVLVNPIRNLHYVNGSKLWAGVLPMAVVGIARAYGIDLGPYLSPLGHAILRRFDRAPILAMPLLSGVTWKQLAKPEYANPEEIPILVRVTNQLILGRQGLPTVPLLLGQGAYGELEGTSGSKPGIGRGDGVMVAGDVRTLARQYCAAGLSVEYKEYGRLSHVQAAAAWMPRAFDWIMARFSGRPATQNCSSIAPGNEISPLPEE